MKSGESSIELCWRLAPFSHVKSPKAKGSLAASSGGPTWGGTVGAKAGAGVADAAGANGGAGTAGASGGAVEGAGALADAAGGAGAGGAAAGGAPTGWGVACASAEPSTNSTLASPAIHPQRVRVNGDEFIFTR